MTGVRRAYSSTVVAAGHLAACAVLAAALLSCGIAFLPTGAAAATAVDAAVIVLAGLQMATVRLSDGVVHPGQYTHLGRGRPAHHRPGTRRDRRGGRAATKTKTHREGNTVPDSERHPAAGKRPWSAPSGSAGATGRRPGRAGRSSSCRRCSRSLSPCWSDSCVHPHSAASRVAS